MSSTNRRYFLSRIPYFQVLAVFLAVPYYSMTKRSKRRHHLQVNTSLRTAFNCMTASYLFQLVIFLFPSVEQFEEHLCNCVNEDRLNKASQNHTLWLKSYLIFVFH